MKRVIPSVVVAALALHGLLGAQDKGQPPKDEKKDAPPARLAPGEIRRDVPLKRFRAQLESLDPKTRTGSFRRDGDGEVMTFAALPHVTVLHHAARGDLGDLRPNQRLLFYLFEDAEGKPTLLGTIQDELNELHAHKEYYFVEKVDADKGVLVCTRAPADRSKVVWENLRLETTKDTKYWRAGKPEAKFGDVKVGDPIRAKTYGGKGILERFACDILLDDETLSQWQAEQKKVHLKRLQDDGLPAYVDEVRGREVKLTIFPEATDPIVKDRVLKVKSKVELAAAGVDRKAGAEKTAGAVAALRAAIVRGEYVGQATLTLDADPPAAVKPAALVRVRPVE